MPGIFNEFKWVSLLSLTLNNNFTVKRGEANSSFTYMNSHRLLKLIYSRDLKILVYKVWF